MAVSATASRCPTAITNYPRQLHLLIKARPAARNYVSAGKPPIAAKSALILRISPCELLPLKMLRECFPERQGQGRARCLPCRSASRRQVRKPAEPKPKLNELNRFGRLNEETSCLA